MTLEELKEHYMPIIELAVTRTKEYYEVQLKAKESDLERQDMIIKCLSMDLDYKEKLLKAKDEEIERLKAELNSAFIRDLKSIKMSSNGKHATWGMLKDQQ